MTTKYDKVKNFHLLRVEGFSYSVGVLGISKLHFLIQKKITNFLAVHFFHCLVINTLDLNLDPDPDLHLVLDPGPDPDPQLEKMLVPYPDLH